MEFDKPAGDRQAETQSAEVAGDLFFALLEWLEYVGKNFGLDSDAGVVEFDLELAIRVGGANADLAAGGGEFHGILQEVPEDLLDSSAVAQREMFRRLEM